MDKKQSLWILGAVALGSALYNIFKPIHSKTKVIDNFDISRFLGHYHEMARIDDYWSKNQENVVYEFTGSADSEFQMTKSSNKTNSEKQLLHKAKLHFGEDRTEGRFEIKTFGPLFNKYQIVSIDNDYSTVLIFGRNNDYLWILSKANILDENIKRKYLRIATEAGFDPNKIVWKKNA